MPESLPALGFGTWKEEPAAIEKAVEAALRAGFRHIDCAYNYENEEGVGRAFHRVFSDPESGVRREDVWVTGKLWNCWHRPEDVRKQCMQTLKDLQLEYLDLFLVHWPFAFVNDPKLGMYPRDEKGEIVWDSTSLFETWRAMEALVDEGLVKHIGVSNYTVALLRDLLNYSRIKPYALQIECHPWLQQKVLIDFAQSKGIYITCYSPLGGFYEGKASIQHDKALAKMAADRGCSPAQLVIAWHLQKHPKLFSIIPKSSNAGRIKENFAAKDIRLSAEEMAAIDAMDCGRRFLDCNEFWQVPLFTD